MAFGISKYLEMVRNAGGTPGWQQGLSTNTDPAWVAQREAVAVYYETTALQGIPNIGGIHDTIRHYATIARNAPNETWFNAEAANWKSQHPGSHIQSALIPKELKEATPYIAGAGVAAGLGAALYIGATSTAAIAAPATEAAAVGAYGGFDAAAVAGATYSGAGAAGTTAAATGASSALGNLWQGVNNTLATLTNAYALARRCISILTGGDRPQQANELNSPALTGGNFGSIYGGEFPYGSIGSALGPGSENETFFDMVARNSGLIWIVAAIMIGAGIFLLLKRR